MHPHLFYEEQLAVRRIWSLFLIVVGLALLSGVSLFLPFAGGPFDPFPEDGGGDTLLVLWVHPFGMRMEIPDCRERFGWSGCQVTDDRSLYPRADAVLIHHRDVSSGAAPLPPEPRPRGQKWIWMNLESPTHSPRLWEFEGVYNLTLSYRGDADVSLPYGFLIADELMGEVPRGRFVYQLGGGAFHSDRHRPHLVAWVVSHWSRTQARVAFYQQLRDHIQIDVFGRAGQPIPPGGQVVVDLIRQYRFYLALENSQHTDYITEKLWNAVRGGAIPVVLGPPRKNYERFLPPKAFIHVDDFSTPQELAQYLLKVKDSPALTEMHLRWREHYNLYIPTVWSEYICKACKTIQKSRGRINIVKNLTRWFNS